MNTIFKLSLLNCFLFYSLFSYSQTNFCGFDSLMLSWKKTDPSGYNAGKNAHLQNVIAYRNAHTGINYVITPNSGTGFSLSGGNSCPQVNYILPVVVHIIHLVSDATVGVGSNIRDSQVDSQMMALNEAYRNGSGAGSMAVNTGIQFCLASKKPDGTSFSGITRTSSSRSITRRPKEYLDSLIALIQYPTDRYINVYVVKTILDSVGGDNGILGYASYPYSSSRNKDALVIRSNWFGVYNGGSSLNNLADGKVMIHEMGHYLGLYHPFQEGCSGLDSTNCKTSGDLCCDVPAVIAENTSCSTQNTCTDYYKGSDPFDQKENYMDYTTPSCKNTFTPDQANIMYSVLEGTRSSLWDPRNINNLQLACCMNNARFSGLDFGCKADSMYYTAYIYDSSIYTWYLFKKDTLRATYTTYNGKLQIKLDTGNYVLKLQVDVGSGRFSYTFPHIIKIVDCSNPLKSTRGNWYFGQYAGIRFFNGGKVFRDIRPFQEYKFGNQSINIYEGTISVSDTAGKLKFYGGPHTMAEDILLYDKNYQKMFGSPIHGDLSASQGIISIQHSKKPSIYYLFHINNVSSNKFKYSKVDLSMTSSTQGELLNQNTIIYDSAGVTLDAIGEGITTLTGCNDSTYWIIISRTYPQSLLIYKFVNGVLSYNSSFGPISIHFEDKVRFSPNGNMFTYGPYICSFDRSNAQIKILYTDNSISRVYDAVFSKDSRLLYRSENSLSSINAYSIYQLDLESQNPNLSKVLILPYSVGRQSLQMGADGKIYITNFDSKYLSVINSPSNRQFSGNNCGYSQVGVTLGSDGQSILCHEGLPNFIDANNQTEIAADFLIQPTTCKTISFLNNQCCASSYKWHFGDGDSSTSKNPAHTYTDTGVYTVTMKAGTLTKIKTIRIGVKKKDLKILGDTILCQAGLLRQYSAKLDSNYTSYTWKPTGYSSSNSDNNRVEIMWSGSGSLKLIITDKNGCKDSSSVSITQATNITNNTIPSSLALCDTSTISTITGSTPSGGLVYAHIFCLTKCTLMRQAG